MRILALADQAPRESMRALIARHQPELIVLLGDLRASFIDGVADAISYQGIPAVGVYGNHCDGRYLEEAGIINVHARVVDVGGIRIGGMEGCVRYKAAPMFTPPQAPGVRADHQYEQAEADAIWSSLPPCQLVISHAPPFGINDTVEKSHPDYSWDSLDAQVAAAADLAARDPSHVGWIAGRRYLSTHRPTWWLHGHTYPPEHHHSRQILGTAVHYIVQDRVIDLDEQPAVDPGWVPTSMQPTTGRPVSWLSRLNPFAARS
jgi:uncharacterized protein